MLNDLWAGMILVGIIYGALTGRDGRCHERGAGLFQGSSDTLYTMLGVNVFFGVGLMENFAQRVQG